MFSRFALLFASQVLADKVTLLPPVDGKSGDPAVWIVLPGAYIDESLYAPLGERVQQECSMPLWVAVLGTALTPTPIPGEIGPRIDYVLDSMKDQGLDLAKAKLFYGGHSLGSVMIQDHLKKYHGNTGPKGGSVEVLGQVLMGGFIQRKYSYPDFSYPVSTLTIGGELDGLARPTRLAEAYFHAQEQADFPVVILQGVTHNQFASGDPTGLVKARDLQPEVSYDDAHAAMAQVIAPYFEDKAGVASSVHGLAEAHAFTADFVQPIIEAYQEEGGRYMGTPEQFGGDKEKDCNIDGDNGLCHTSCAWTVEAQKTISTVSGWNLDIHNNFANLGSTPLSGGAFHLPVITNDTSTKTISITTYSQHYWDDAQPSWFAWKSLFDSYDTGFVATSAFEIASKLASRQSTLISGAGEADTAFDVDDPDFCKQANENAYAWALDRAGAATKARFTSKGQKYEFVADKQVSGGPLFLYGHMGFDEADGANGEKVIQVKSVSQKTEVDYWKNHFGPIPRPPGTPDPGGYHYCKLLSPARAMEWIYIDSLRLRGSVASEILV
jgi:hypothetical protein